MFTTHVRDCGRGNNYITIETVVPYSIDTLKASKSIKNEGEI